MKSFFLGVFGALTVLISAAIIIPQYNDYVSQVETRRWLRQVKDVQKEIETQLLAGESLKDGIIEKPVINIYHKDHPNFFENVDYFNIRPDGMILIKGGSDKQMIILMPKLIDGKIHWECIGGSNNALPKQCQNLNST